MSTSDRSSDDRNYFNAHDRSGEVFLATGLGVYPNLGVVDAFATARHGDTQRSVRFSDAGTRHPEHVRMHLTTPLGEPLLLEIDALLGILLSMGSGYVGDSA